MLTWPPDAWSPLVSDTRILSSFFLYSSPVAAVGEAVAGPRGARGARAERADERRHDGAVGVVRGGGPDGAEPPAAAEAGDLELAAGVGAEH